MRVRSGMTLIEVLVSLSLLAVLMTVAVSWMTTILSTQAREGGQASWLRSSHTVLDLIEQDLIVLDRLDMRRARTPRVEIVGDTLRIRTRDKGEVGTRVYALDAGSGKLERAGLGTHGIAGEPPLLGGVEHFVVLITPTSETQLLPTLRVALQGADDQHTERVYVLSRGDIE